jgi:hypothetical protein
MVSPTQRKQYEAEITPPPTGNAITYAAVVGFIDTILRAALSRTIDDLDRWIDTYVPKRTGQLRDSLKANLRSSRVIQGKLLKLYFGTRLDYAEFVNEMTTSQVAHSGETGYAYYYGHYGRITLDDPNAIGNFFDAMINYARMELQSNIQNAIMNLWYVPRNMKINLINYVVVRRT